MARTNIDLDDAAVERVMRRYGFRSKRETVNYAVRRLDVEPMSLDEALAMEGTGLAVTLDELRQPGQIPRL